MGVFLRNNKIFGSSNPERPLQETTIVPISDGIDVDGNVWVPFVGINHNDYEFIQVEFQLSTAIETKNVLITWNKDHYVGNMDELGYITYTGEEVEGQPDILYCKIKVGNLFVTENNVSVRCLNTIPSGFHDLTGVKLDGKTLIENKSPAIIPIELESETLEVLTIQDPSQITHIEYNYNTLFKPNLLDFNITDNKLTITYDGEDVKTIENDKILFSNGLAEYSPDTALNFTTLLNKQNYFQQETTINVPESNLGAQLAIRNKNGNGKLIIEGNSFSYEGLTIADCNVPIIIKNLVLCASTSQIKNCADVILENCSFTHSSEFINNAVEVVDSTVQFVESTQFKNGDSLIVATNSVVTTSSNTTFTGIANSFITTNDYSIIYNNATILVNSNFEDDIFAIDSTSVLHNGGTACKSSTHFPGNSGYPVYQDTLLQRAFGGVYSTENYTVTNISMNKIRDVCNNLPKIINGKLELVFAQDPDDSEDPVNYTNKPIYIKGLSGNGELIIKAVGTPANNSHKFDQFIIENCSLRSITVEGFTSNTDSENGIVVKNCNSNEILLSKIWFNATEGARHTNNIYISNSNSQVEINRVISNAGETGVYATQSNFIYTILSTFNNVTNALISDGAIIHILGNNTFGNNVVVSTQYNNGIIYSGDITQTITPETEDDSFILTSWSNIILANSYVFSSINGFNGAVHIEKRGRDIQLCLKFNYSASSPLAVGSRVIATLPNYLFPKAQMVVLDALVTPHDGDTIGLYALDCAATINDAGEIQFINKTAIGDQNDKYIIITGCYFGANSNYK
jgi:hypothetical protein